MLVRFAIVLLALSPFLRTGAAPLRTVSEIFNFRDTDATNTVPFETRGQVLNAFHIGDTQFASITDNKAGLSFRNQSNTPCRSGDLVHIGGFVNRNPAIGQTGIFVTSLEILGSASLPETAETVGYNGGPQRFGRLQGVISHVFRDEIDACYNWIVLRTPYGKLLAAATEDEHPLSRLRELVDAEVLLKGSISQKSHFHKSNMFNLCLFGKTGLEILNPAPTDPFAAPSVSSPSSLHRERAEGSILACGQSGVLIRTDQGRFLQTDFHTNIGDLNPGDRVTVVGFTQDSTYGLYFANALLRRKSGPSAFIEPPVDLSEKELFTNPLRPSDVNAIWHGKTVRLRGRLASTRDECRLTGILRVELPRHTLFVDTTALPTEHTSDLPTGSTVDVSGICLAEFSTDNQSSFAMFRRFLIVPRDRNDLVLVHHPPWWTATKLLVLITLLIFVIVAVLIWNRSLHILSERRGRALSLALTARIRAESRTQERTRLAVELHDSLSQTLTGVALQIDAATTATAIDDARRKTYLSTAKNLLASCRKSLQDCLWDLRSRTFEEADLSEALSLTLTPFKDKCHLDIHCNIPREVLSESTLHAILSIVRELVTNAIRHGHATQVRIEGARNNETVRFSVTDNGCGFEPLTAPGPQDGHFGLQGVRERVNDFNGSFDLTSAPGRGSTVVITLIIREPGVQNEESQR